MRRAALLLLLPSLALAAPVPKGPAKPPVEVTLAAESPRVLEVTLRNTGKEALELAYHATPFELFVVDLQGENGGKYKIEHKLDEDDRKEHGKLTIPAGESKTLTLHSYHYLNEVGNAGENFTFTATLKLGSQAVSSKPLTVK